MINEIKKAIFNLNLSDGVYTSEGSLPDGRIVHLDVKVYGAYFEHDTVYGDITRYSVSDIEIQFVEAIDGDTEVELHDDTLEFWLNYENGHAIHDLITDLEKTANIVDMEIVAA